MTQWELSRRWRTGLVLVGLVGLLLGCEQPGGEGCGGIENLVSCVSITSISPTNIAGTATSDVDVVQAACSVDATTGQVTFESFGAHNATIAFANTAFPNASGSLAVTLRRVTVSYTLNNCPSGAICPPLPSITENVSTLIPESGTASGTFPFVPLSVKEAYINQGGDTARFPSYTANYVFTGQTQFFTDNVTIRGSAAFVLGNFNLCQ